MNYFNLKNFYKLHKKTWIIINNDDQIKKNLDDVVYINTNSIQEYENIFSLSKFIFEKYEFFSNIYFKKINALLNFLQDENGELLQKMHINSLPYLEVSGILENCSIRNPHINSCLQCIGLEILVRQLKPKKIIFLNDENLIYKSIKNLKLNYKIKVKNKEMSTPKLDFFLLRSFVRMIILFLEVLKLKFISKIKFRTPINNNKYLLFTYSSDFKKSRNFYLSNYFRDLIVKFNENKKYFDVGLIYSKVNKMSRTATIHKYFQFNKYKSNNIFLAIDEYLNFKNYFKTIYYFFLFRFLGKRIEKKLNEFSFEQGSINPWYFINNNWKRYFYGGTGVNFILQTLQLYDFITKTKEYEKVIICWEGMLWEKVFCYYWKKFKKSSIYGYQHTFLKIGDLRQKKIIIRGYSKNFYPDKILCIGKYFQDQIISYGYNKNDIIYVEALRYLYLNEIKINSTNENDHLVLLEGNLKSDLVLLHFFELMVLKNKNKSSKFFIKVHPGSDLQELKKFKFIKKKCVELIVKDINYIISFNGIIYTSLNSSVAFECSLLNKKLVLIKIPDILIRTNYKTLPWDSISLFQKDKLVKIVHFDNHSLNNDDKSKILNLNKNLKLWEKFLV